MLVFTLFKTSKVWPGASGRLRGLCSGVVTLHRLCPESLEVSGVSWLVALCVEPHEQARLCSSSSDSQGWGAGLGGVLLSWLTIPFLLLMAKI